MPKKENVKLEIFKTIKYCQTDGLHRGNWPYFWVRPTDSRSFWHFFWEALKKWQKISRIVCKVRPRLNKWWRQAACVTMHSSACTICLWCNPKNTSVLILLAGAFLNDNLTQFFWDFVQVFSTKNSQIDNRREGLSKKNKVIRWALDSTESFTMCRLSVFKICKFWKFHLSLFRVVNLEISRHMGC